jgi:hypothetical protein
MQHVDRGEEYNKHSPSYGGDVPSLFTIVLKPKLFRREKLAFKNEKK